MRCPDAVDVKLLHQNDIPAHIVTGYAIAVFGVGIVPVYALKLNGNAVYQKLAHRRRSNRSNAYLLIYILSSAFYQKTVQIWILRIP